jgi:PAS domain S-box-containing protein
MVDGQTTEDKREIARLLDEVEQLRTALEASGEEVDRLVEDRDRLMRRVTGQARELQGANAAYSKAVATQGATVEAGRAAQIQSDHDQEELRVAFEEMQVLTEELETANNSLQEANKALDHRVEERTRELEAKNRALTESEARFRTLVEGIPQLVWRAVDGGEWTWASPQWVAYTGLDTEESAGQGWLRALHPEDRALAEAAWARAQAGEPLDMTVRIFHQAENHYRHFSLRATAVRGEHGAVPEWLGTSTDIDDLRRLQDRQQLLLAELQHRVRNILTVVRSVFARTIDVGGELDQVADHFVGRLDSLARTQVIVTQSATGEVDLENLVRDELLSVGATDGPNLTIDGPDVDLPAKAAESIGLAIHELVTNALKYGALRVPSATLQIRWNTNMDKGGDRQLNLIWSEQGVPIVPLVPARRGFGSELITEALPYRLGAETSLEFRGGGVRCTISVPLGKDVGSGGAAEQEA